MKFSTRSFFLVFAFYSLLLGLVFVAPSGTGWLVLSLLSMIVLPPFVQVGLFTTQGYRRAFFIGAAVGGLPHFLYCLYFCVFAGLGSMLDPMETFGSIFDLNDDNGLEARWMSITHLIGILLASFSGLSGMLSYWLLHGGKTDAQPRP